MMRFLVPQGVYNCFRYGTIRSFPVDFAPGTGLTARLSEISTRQAVFNHMAQIFQLVGKTGMGIQELKSVDNLPVFNGNFVYSYNLLKRRV